MSTWSTTTRTARTDHSISTHPQAALPSPAARPSDHCDETASADSSIRICRWRDVTEFSDTHTHRALQLRPPRPEGLVPEPVYGRIRRPILGGLINEYEPAA